MKNNYINIYNNLINLTRNKNLYKDFTNEDTFSDRLILFLFHFAFFLRFFKSKSNPKTLQDIYDYIFNQLELSIREIGYGDASINKKMKDYINIFYSILEKINSWDNLDVDAKSKILTNFLNFEGNLTELSNYFDNYSSNLKNKTLNYYTKGVIKPEL